MAYRSGASKTYLNSEEFVVKSFNKDKMRLEQTDTNNEIEVDLKFTSHFKPMYAMTVHKAQGMTINEPYSIYESKRMKKRHAVCSFNQNIKERVQGATLAGTTQHHSVYET